MAKRLRLYFEVDVDESGVADYASRYPELVSEDGSIAETLAREAIAQWEWECLVTRPEFTGWEERDG